VKPRSRTDALDGESQGALLVRLAAPPVEGRANAALARLLGRVVGVAPSSVKILRGATGREKLLKFEGLSAAALRDRLEKR
jgi:hypothetical protein